MTCQVIRLTIHSRNRKAIGRLNVGRWIHSANNGLHNTRSCQRRVRLPLFDTRTVLVIGDTSYHCEILSTISKDTFDDGVHFGIESKSTKPSGKFLPELIVSCNLSTRSDWCQVDSRTTLHSNEYTGTVMIEQ